MKRFAALLLAIMCMCSFAHAEELSECTGWLTTDVTQPISELFASDTLLTTIGTAEAVAPIDIATLSFSVEAEGETVAEANQKVTASIQAITDLLKAQGVEETQIWHKRYDVTPNVVYHNTKMSGDRVIEGYLAKIVLCVRLTDITLVGVAIDAAMQTGADSTHELEFERSTAQAVYDEALAQAAQQAMARAQHLAQSCGMELGGLVSITELSSVEDAEARVEVIYRAR